MFINSNCGFKDGNTLNVTQGAVTNYSAWDVYGYALELVWTGMCSYLGVIGFPGSRETNVHCHTHSFQYPLVLFSVVFNCFFLIVINHTKHPHQFNDSESFLACSIQQWSWLWGLHMTFYHSQEFGFSVLFTIWDGPLPVQMGLQFALLVCFNSWLINHAQHGCWNGTCPYGR